MSSFPASSLWRTVRGERGLGCIPDPKGRRHRDIDRLAMPAAIGQGVFTVEDGCGPVLDQLGTSSCVAQALLDEETTTLRARYGLTDVKLGSRLQLYRGARLLAGGPIVDMGCHPSDALKWLEQNGIAPEHAWPFSVRKVNAKPPVSARWDARQRRGVRGTFMASDRGDALIDVLRATLASRRAACLGIPVDQAMKVRAGSDHIHWENRGATVGYHMVGLVRLEYESGQWWGRIKNSWGPGWRDGGYAYLSEGYLRHPIACAIVDPEEPAR